MALRERFGQVVKETISARIPEADLDDRDPDYVRENLPGLWVLASFYFRAEVRGLERIPAEGPVLLVGNHSGGNVTPDTMVFALAFSGYFGPSGASILSSTTSSWRCRCPSTSSSSAACRLA